MPSSVTTSGFDLDQGRVFAVVDLVELHEHGRDRVDQVCGEAALPRDDLGGLEVDARDRVDVDLRESLGPLDGEDLDLHAALDAAQREVRAVGPVQQHREVELAGDLGALGDHHPLDDVALDVEAEDGLGGLLGILGVVHDLDAAGLAAAAGLHLRLHDDGAADLLGGGPRLGGVSATMPCSTGTPCASNMSRAWYS